MKLPITLSERDFFHLAKAMYESNNNIHIRIELSNNSGERSIYHLWNINQLYSIYWWDKITITSIEVRLPQFSIGDTVMIVDTGEIAKIYQEDDIKMEAINESNNMFFVWSHNENEFYWYFHASQLVKIPTDLLPILQN